jgi:hypothetical protein
MLLIFTELIKRKYIEPKDCLLILGRVTTFEFHGTNENWPNSAVMTLNGVIIQVLNLIVKCYLSRLEGCAIAQAVSRWPPTAAARIRAQGFVVDKVVLSVIPPIAPQLSSMIWGWYNRPNSFRRTKWTQSHSTPRN